jgi:hypothetical protein
MVHTAIKCLAIANTFVIAIAIAIAIVCHCKHNTAH